MRILVDGDATPQREEIAEIARKYNVEMIVYMDYAHLVESEDYTIKQCSVGSDSVDMMIVKDVKEKKGNWDDKTRDKEWRCWA